MGWQRFSIAFDLHGNLRHRPTVAAFLRHVDDFKPHHKIIGGDVWDFAAWREGANDEEKRESVKDDFEAGLQFIDRFKPQAVLLGNHDARLWRVADRRNGPASDLAREYVGRVAASARDLRCRLLPYDKRTVLRVGPLNVLHGVYAGENAAKRHAQTYGPCIFGHVHTGEMGSVPSIDHRLEAWSSPCLCDLNPKYADPKPGTLKWCNGWMLGEFRGKTYHVETARVINGEVRVATGFKTLAA